MQIRIGHGYDVHQLVSERALVLGGVTIPHSHGLMGHSDADVLLHAICDAILGALALGDIGKHFPDTDAQYKDADSRKLLQSVVAEMHALGYVVGNIDATIIAQQPKLAPHILSMCKNIAQDCDCELGKVNVKATTTETLGFVGKQLGMEAHCVVVLQQSNQSNTP